MSSSAEIYKAFNKSIKALIKDLLSSYPEIDQFKLMNASFIITKKLNKKFPFKYFNAYIYKPYHEYIVKKDEAFFLSDAFYSSFWPSLSEAIKKTWVTIPDHDKNAIWNHMHFILAKFNDVMVYKNGKKQIAVEVVSDDEVPATA